MIVKNVEKKENNAAEFQVETSAEEFETAVNGAYLKNRGNIYIPGFRKGKAPRAVVEGMYGAEVFYQDAMDELAPAAFEYGLKESGLRIVGSPSISDVKVGDERTVEYSFTVSLYPEVTLGQYKGLEAAKDAAEVTDAEVDKELEDVRRRNARMITVEDRAAQMGDTVNIDFDGYLEGERFDGGKAEEYSLELGSKSFVPGFEEQIVGMKTGEEKDLDITFPEAYAENLAGKAVVFKVKLNGISYPELPALDDDFAKDVSEFDSLDAYKADVRKNLQSKYDEQADAKFRSDIIRKACENMTVEVPAVMVDEKAEEILRNYANNFGLSDQKLTMDKLKEMLGINDEVMNTNIRPSAEFQVKTELLFEAVAAAEDIQVTVEEAEEYLGKVAESIGAKVEDVRNYFGHEFITAEHKKEKATNLILDSAVVSAAPAEEKAE
ncbi:MAG: trigger factor [Oscillospiraceae bacterium]|nr:trigger factor [Oscillospiraceae bacterium]